MKEHDKRYDDEIIRNRNEFFEKNGIVKASRLRSLDIFHNPTYFDHLESFRDEAGRIFIVCSNYDNGEPNELIVEYGFVKQSPLYIDTASTYLRIFESTDALKEFCRARKKV